MAIYVYRCEAQHDREIIHPMAESPQVVCVVCGEVMVRIPNLGGVMFKGSGFYSTEKGAK